MVRFLPLPALVLFLSLLCSDGETSEQLLTATPSPETSAPAITALLSTATPGPTATPSPTPAPSGRVILNAVGDIMLARDITTLMDEQGSDYPYAAVESGLADADITIANMEGTFTERGLRADKFYTFRTPPRHAIGLAQAGIDIVALGNNHSMDFGAEGLADTLAALDSAGVLHGGAGANDAAAREPVYIEKNGLRLAFLSFNGVSEATFATQSTPGVARADVASIHADVAAARAGADLVIVSIHAGVEYQDAPSGQQQALARAAIDAGAALVLGTHAHVMQGWQRYGRGVIVWGLGNFVFDLDEDDLATLGPHPFETMILQLELGAGGVENIKAVPVFIDPMQNRPVFPEGERLEQVNERIHSLVTDLR